MKKHDIASRKPYLERLQRLAVSRGGLCLSKRYRGAHAHHWFRCHLGHKWRTTSDNIISGTWCPNCCGSIGEKMTREIFEQIFLVPFLKDRPAWLKNSRGGQMELDGYSEELKVAFEYQGYQHFTVDNFRIKKASTLMKRKLDDEEKRKLCEERGILLIQVPEVKLSAGIDGFLAAIRKAYPKIDTFITGKITVDPRRVYTSKFEEKASRLREAVESRGGVLLSSFVDKKMFHRAKVKCDVGHVWSARANHLIAMASWCPYCSKKAKRTIEDMRAVAKLKGGDCLSKKYVSLKKKLLWRCAAGHEWLAVPSNIAHSPSWCPFCSGRRKS